MMKACFFPFCVSLLVVTIAQAQPDDDLEIPIEIDYLSDRFGQDDIGGMSEEEAPRRRFRVIESDRAIPEQLRDGLRELQQERVEAFVRVVGLELEAIRIDGELEFLKTAASDRVDEEKKRTEEIQNLEAQREEIEAEHARAVVQLQTRERMLTHLTQRIADFQRGPIARPDRPEPLPESGRAVPQPKTLEESVAE